MPGGLGENVTVVVPLRLQGGCHPFVRHHPVVQTGLVPLRPKVILAHFQPYPQRLDLALGNQVLVVLPRPVRRLRVQRRLLVHIRPGIGQDAVVQIRAEPRHGKRARTARTPAHCRPPVRVRRKLDARLLGGPRQHLRLHEAGVHVRDSVVFQAPLAALGVAPSESMRMAAITGSRFS